MPEGDRRNLLNLHYFKAITYVSTCGRRGWSGLFCLFKCVCEGGYG